MIRTTVRCDICDGTRDLGIYRGGYNDRPRIPPGWAEVNVNARGPKRTTYTETTVCPRCLKKVRELLSLTELKAAAK